MDRDMGGPAFPQEWSTFEFDGDPAYNPKKRIYHHEKGLTVWDYYAAHAPKVSAEYVDRMRQREMSKIKSDPRYHERSEDQIVADCNVGYADAMIITRKQHI